MFSQATCGKFCCQILLAYLFISITIFSMVFIILKYCSVYSLSLLLKFDHFEKELQVDNPPDVGE